jgi:hypothetical protein
MRSASTDQVRKGRPWSLTLEDRILLVAAYWRTNLTLRQLAPLFGVSKAAGGRATVLADGGYRGTGLLIPHRRERGQTELPPS